MAPILRFAVVVSFTVATVAVAQKPAEPERENLQSKSQNTLVLITPKRIVMAPRVAALCLPHQVGRHGDPAEVLIYANKIAIDYRREHQTAFNYPVGSKFVKEKFAKPGDKQPDAATIMEKVATKGKVSDWRFSSISLPDKTRLKTADKESCAACHKEYKENGFVSDESESALKQYFKSNQ